MKYVWIGAVVVVGLVVVLIVSGLLGTAKDASRIVFETWRTGNPEVFVMDSDGSNPRNLTNHLGQDTNPTLSPDRSMVAFVSDRDGNEEIYVTEVKEGSSLRRLTNNTANDRDPTWSPDGARIAFASLRDGNWEIYVMDADGGNPQNVTFTPNEGELQPTWSPDGKSVAFIRGSAVHDVFAVSGTGSGAAATLIVGDGVTPSWSPDGKRIAFARTVPPSNAAELFVVSLDGSQEVRLTSNAAGDFQPCWSPSGSHLVFTRRVTTPQGLSADVWIIAADGTGEKQLTSNPSLPPAAPPGPIVGFGNPDWR